MGNHIKQHCCQKPNICLAWIHFDGWLIYMKENTILPLMELEPVSPQKVSSSNKKVFFKKCYLDGDIKSKKSVRQCTAVLHKEHHRQRAAWDPRCVLQYSFTNYKADILDSISRPCLIISWLQSS